MSILQFLKSKVFLVNLAVAIAVVVVGLTIVFFGLGIYTRQGKTITVPQLKGYKEHQITNALEKLHLRYTIIDSVHKDNTEPGVIVEQIPEGGTKVKKDRMLFITINAFSAEQVKMPALIDYSLRNAEVMLESFGLKKGKIIYTPSEYPNLVLGQKYRGKDIQTGTSIPKGSTIDLIVGSGLGSSQAVVPDLLGLTLDEARKFLQAENMFSIGAIVCDETVITATDSVVALIYRQSPSPAEQSLLTIGSSLNVWISKEVDRVMSAMGDSAIISNQQEEETE
jgi:beta-lactam-binding protein with PASTA domain